MSGGGGEAGAVCSFCLVLKLNDCTQICSYSFQTFQTQTFFCLFIFLIYETGTPPPCWPLMSRAASLHCSFCTKVKPLLAFFSFYFLFCLPLVSHCVFFFLPFFVCLFRPFHRHHHLYHTTTTGEERSFVAQSLDRVAVEGAANTR